MPMLIGLQSIIITHLLNKKLIFSKNYLRQSGGGQEYFIKNYKK
jgi:hypothetical protein